MRDHLLGYAPSAAHSAELDDGPDYFWGDFEAPFPLGVPTRLIQENKRKVLRFHIEAGAESRRINDFNKKLFPNPDGSSTTAGGKKLRAEQAKHRASVCKEMAELIATQMQSYNQPEVVRLRGVSVKPPPGRVLTAAAVQEAVRLHNAGVSSSLYGQAQVGSARE